MSHPAIIKEYSYKPKKLMVLLGFLFFGLGVWFFMSKALTNDNGLVVKVRNLWVEFSLSPSKTTFFYWVLCLLSFCMTCMSLWQLYKAFFSNSKIILTDEAIIAPAGYFSKNKTLTVIYKDILSLEVNRISNVRTLVISYLHGKLEINDNMLPNKSQLDEIVKVIERHFATTSL